ncbi:MAG TPA: tetratricopeptide repeat protein [Chitinophagaceae bacterium]|nr:tetratricopeptide repeat protein [Chitinophagaceae bacterium]
MNYSRTYRRLGVLAGFFFIVVASLNAQGGDNVNITRFNQMALSQIELGKYDEAIKYCDSALAIGENATSYYYLAFIHNIQNKWEEAIEYSKKSTGLNPGITRNYLELLTAYSGAHRWKDAVEIGEKAFQMDTSPAMNEKLGMAHSFLAAGKIANVLLLLLFIIFSCLVIIPYSKVSATKFKYAFANEGHPPATLVTLIASCVSCGLYILFFSLSNWIWSLNPSISPAEFTPLIRAYIYEHDGIEMIVMYMLMFVNIWTSLLVTYWASRLRISKRQYFTAAIILLGVAGFYCYSIGFLPPLPHVSSEISNSFIPGLLISVFSAGLYFLYSKSRLLVKIILFSLIAFTTLVVSYRNSSPDLTYVFSPALRLIHGATLSEIYFQYDILLSLFAAAWMKMNLSLDWFPFIAQAAFFIFFICMFIFSDRFFKSKGLSVLFIIALVLVRYYATYEQQITIFQVSPLRLDLWLVLLIVAYTKGYNHWLFGICLAFLIILHRNLGLIYLGAYLALIVFLFVSQIVSQFNEKKLDIRSILYSFFRSLSSYKVNLGIIALTFILYYILAGEFFSSSGINYRKYGIGMLPVSKDSFYWYVPVILSSLFVLLFYYREKLGPKYFATGIFVLLLAISNSMYFFGRSHENNILNISALLILALFVLFDILFSTAAKATVRPVAKTKKAAEKPIPSINKSVFVLLPLLLIFLIGFFYSSRISGKVNAKLENVAINQFVYPLLPGPVDTGAIRQLTKNSDKVYFLDFYADFYYYYYGGYKPRGYFSPCASWVFKKDLTTFLQTLLDDQYFIVADKNRLRVHREFLDQLKYNKSEEKSSFIAISK